MSGIREIEHRAPVVSRVRDLLLRRSGRELPSLAQVAKELNLSARSIARHLQHAGVRYRDLLVELRLEQVLHLMESRHLTAKEVSYELGFRDVNAFRRAFKKWTGKTFSEYWSSSRGGVVSTYAARYHGAVRHLALMPGTSLGHGSAGKSA